MSEHNFEPFLTKVIVKSVIIYPKIEDGVMNVYLKADIIDQREWVETGRPEPYFTGKNFNLEIG